MASGAIAAFFLNALEWATHQRSNFPYLVYGLPVVGLLISLFYKNTISAIFVSGALTHLTGGSAGREGAIIQMGDLAMSRMGRYLKFDEKELRFFLVVAIAAGFSAAIGVPYAGMIFGIESMRYRNLKNKIVDHDLGFFTKMAPLLLLCSLLAAKISQFSSMLFGAVHTAFPRIEQRVFDPAILIWILVAGVLFGFAAELFKILIYLVRKSKLKTWMAGFLLIGLYFLEGSHQYEGLGVPVIVKSLAEASSLMQPFWKSILTAITVGTGFKGGEFTPLVFIGSTLGSALSHYMPLSFQLLGALGFVSVFAGVAQTPFACAIAAVELFGPNIGIYAIITCVMSAWMARVSKLHL